MLEDAPYKACSTCPVEGWCTRRSGETPLPVDYAINHICILNALLSKALELSKIPREFINANKRNYKVADDNGRHTKMIVKILNDPVGMVEKGSNVALIHPNKGTGKTFTACAIINEFIYKTCVDPKWFDYENPVALYVKYGDWANEIRRAHQVHLPEIYEAMYSRMDTMKEVPLLVIDDIGSGRITDIIRDLTYDIIDYRKEQQKSTVFTSNLTDTDLEDESKLGETIVSRLMFNTGLIDLGGRDRRKG